MSTDPSIIFAIVASLVFQRNNVDARGWWPVAIIFGEFCAILFALLFALLALMMHRNHNRYTNSFASAIFVGYIIFSLLPWQLVYFGHTDLFEVYIILLFVFHLIFCIYQQQKKTV